MIYQKHVFICVNERKDGSRKSCGEEHGMELVKVFKKAIKDAGLDYPIRAQRAGCLDLCEQGPAVVVYPEGIFYRVKKTKDVQEIVQEHLLNNRPVERLMIKSKK